MIKQFFFARLMRRYDAFLFDMDGTLLDSEPCFKQAWHIILARRGVDLSKFHYKEFRGCGGGDQALGVIRKLGLADDAEALLQEWIVEADKLVFKKIDLCPGANEILNLCEEMKMPKALVTSSGGAYAKKILTQAELIHRFSFLVTRSTMENFGTTSKPAPHPYTLACWRLEIDPSRALVFEDSEVGVRSAKAAGCPTIGISHGSSASAQKMKAAGADIIITTLPELELDTIANLP